MNITYSLIKPLIVDVEVQGQRVFVEFQQPDTGNFVEAQAPVRRSNSVGSSIGRSVKRTAIQQARSSITRMVGSLFGGGFLGRTARAATSTAASEYARSQNEHANAPSEQDIEEAVVAAFKTVRNQFHYNEATNSWGKAQGGGATLAPREKTPFEAQIDRSPIVDRHDRKVFARILADLVNADGVIMDEEVAFFQSLVPVDAGSIHDILATDPVSKVDCEMVKDGVRDTIYMFSWAIVMVDYEIHPKEVEMMGRYADMLGISDAKRTELQGTAKVHMLEQALTPDVSREELFELADSLNMNHDDAERAKIAWLRRVG